MNYDVPARVVWVANLSAEGIRNSDYTKVIDDEQIGNNTSSTFSNVDSVFNQVSTSSSYVSTTTNYTITDYALNKGNSDFNYNFSPYSGPLFPSVTLLGVNYFCNNTSFDIKLVMNSNNYDLSPQFSFTSLLQPGAGTDSKTIIVPAGTQNFPCILYCNANAVPTLGLGLFFDCTIEINGLPSSQITTTNNVATWNG